MASDRLHRRPPLGAWVLALSAAGCATDPSATTLRDAEPARDGGLDAGPPPNPGLDAALTQDAATPPAANLDAALAADAKVPLDSGLVSSACGYPTDIRDASCAPNGLSCGRTFMCYTATAVGPVGIDHCECVDERWSCTDTCAAWQAPRDASQ